MDRRKAGLIGRIAARIGAERERGLPRFSALWSWERSAFGLPRALLSFLVLFALGMLLISLVGNQGLIAYSMLRAERQTLQQDVEALHARELALAREIEALRGSPAYIEQVARRKLGFVKPGEIVVQLPEEPRER
jgi:cell division protein FtsB